MRNITLTAEESLIERARKKAAERNHSLNEEFRSWLREFTADAGAEARYVDVMRKLSHARPGRRFTRDEANGR